ncbi:MAG: ABC transporter ATP-binding protein [Clostridiales bacterium]|nr:ABC transporter ATP-binding protein [Clostridiales bacterium]
MITATDLCKEFNGGAVKALRGVSLNIERGSFVAIIGASGSGKSTLMNVMSGLERADSGSVVACGQDLSAMTDKQLTEFRREYVGFVFQQYYLLPHLSVEKNVRLGADLAGNKDYIREIEAVGLVDKLKAMPSALSGGEQQRVCIARALAKKPQILFLDEPTGALDESTGRSVLDYIAKLKAERGFTMVMVTHNRNIADMANTVVEMNSGKIVSVTDNPAPKSAYEIGW